ncbi:MAG: hydrogenase maturation protease [Pseudomonadota bacterium]
MPSKTIILGLGNTILTDDGAGIYVVRDIESLLRSKSRISIKEASVGGFNFVDLLSGYDRAVIIDAIHTKGGTPGDFYELDPAALKPSARLSSLHQIDFATACELAKRMGVPFPNEIAIFVMEVKDEFSFGESPTPKVAEAIPKMAESIVKTLDERGWLKGE